MFMDISGPGPFCCETVKKQSTEQESVSLSSINVIQSRKYHKARAPYLGKSKDLPQSSQVRAAPWAVLRPGI